MIRLNPSIFDQTGDPIGFSVTSPSGTQVSPGGLPLRFTTSSVDAVFDVTIRGRLRDVDQSEVVRVTGGGPSNSVYSYDHISSLGKETLEANLRSRIQLARRCSTFPQTRVTGATSESTFIPRRAIRAPSWFSTSASARI